MKYKVSFSVTDTYPTAEIEAKDRNEAMRLYQDMWEKGQFSEQSVQKDARYSVMSIWKPKGK
jgi:hypothetical protein